MSFPDGKRVFEPGDTGEVLLGWLLHAHKGRQRHDLAARRCDRARLWLGGPAAVLSAIVGTSVFAALGKEVSNPIFKVGIAAISITSAILTALATFLNLSERAEKHRSAGVRYKEVIRDLERILSEGMNNLDQPPSDPSVAAGIQKRLDELEESAPIVAERIYDRVESEWNERGVAFINKAADLYKGTNSV
jgi:hypothetical protein